MAKIIYNDIIPWKGCKLITIWPFVFARNGVKLTDEDANHESVHLYQQFEMLVASAVLIAALILLFDLSWWWMLLAPLVYFIWYITEYTIRLFLYGNHKEAYRNIATEQEAYQNEKNFDYLRKERKPFAWVKYLTRKTYKRN